jgi:hypothetical protein
LLKTRLERRNVRFLGAISFLRFPGTTMTGSSNTTRELVVE